MEDGMVAKDDGTSSLEAKQQCLQGKDEDAVTVETTSSIDAGMKNNDDDDYDDDDGSDEIEDGELVSSSSSESELEPEESVEEKGKSFFGLSLAMFSARLSPWSSFVHISFV